MDASRFELTRDSPLRTILVDQATSNAKYQIDTPFRFTGRVTKIKKFDQPQQVPRKSDSGTDSSDDPTDTEKKSKSKKADVNLRQNSEEIATVQWHCFSLDRITFLGTVTTRGEFLPKCGKLNRSFKFTGPDGVEYRWAMGAVGLSYPRLVTADDKKTVVAQFYPRRYLWKRRKAQLEVQPAGMKMLDQIVLTFVFAEKIRRHREMAASSGGGWGWV